MKRIHYGWLVLVLCTMAVLGALGFARFGYTMILPSMLKGLDLSEVQAGDLATGNLVGYLTLAIVCGALATRLGPRVVVSVSLVAVSAAMALTAVAPSYPVALAGRLLAGMGGAGANIPVMGLVAAWFGVQRRGLAAGIAVSGSSFALLITGLVIPRIVAAGGEMGWRYSWIALAAATLLIAAGCALWLRNSPADRGLSAIGGTERKEGYLPSGGSARRIFASPSVYHLSLIYLLFGFSYIIYATFFARYLTAEAGFTTEQAGRLWSIVGAASIGSGFLWGTVSDRLGRKYALALVFALQCLCFGIFGLWRAPAGYYVSAGLFALTAWSIPAIMAAAAGDALGARLAPAALGFMTFFFGIGQVAGPFLAGRIAALTHSYSKAFIMAAVAAAGGAAGSLLLSARRQK